MSTMIRQRYHAYQFGSSVSLLPQHLDRLTNQFSAVSDPQTESILGGRRSVSILSLDGIGRVVVKHYRRGGLLAWVNKKTYMRTGKPRCQLEFEQMAYARSLGVQTPEPVAYAYRGGFLYHGWLVTREIEDQCSLAYLSVQAPDRAQRAIQKLGSQVATLIEHKILHADFHPGNVLVDNRDQIFIIDFDKARIFTGSRHKLKARYLQRWRRAVHKHRLTKMLDDQLRALL